MTHRVNGRPIPADARYAAILSPTQVREARDKAWTDYLFIGHADPLVGRVEYRAQIDAIEAREVGNV